jgi:two-component system OmpR family response regulator
VVLPDVDGFEIVRRLRRDGSQVPVIFLTAKDTQEDKVTGRAGAQSSRPGSGLGLAIAAEIAAAHGGSALASPAVPHGLRITLTLPGRVPPDPRTARELASSAS